MIIAGYGRVSTAKDAQLESLENQIEFFSQYADAHQYELFRVYADEGISGKQAKNRKEFIHMIEDAKSHLFDMVVVKDISRFARNTVDLLTATRELRASGIEVQFLSNNQTILGNSEFVLTVFGALAQEESASLSKRVKFGKKMNAQKGRVPNQVYGYRKVDTFHLEILDEEAELIRSVFDMFVNQGLGTRRICAKLNDEGCRTRSQVLWRPTTVRRMMKNPIYCGVLETHKYDTVDFLSGKKRILDESERFRLERPELAIISKEMWERAQQVFQERTEQFHGDGEQTGNSRPSRFSSLHLFSSLIRCEDCGYSYSRHHWNSKKSGPVYYWVCAGRNNFSSSFCPNGTSLKEKDLMETLRQYFLSVIQDKPGFIRQAVDLVERELVLRTASQEPAGEVEKKIDGLKRREARYKEMYANDLISMDELRESMAAVQNKIHKLQSQRMDRDALDTAYRNAKSKVMEGFSYLEHLMDLSEWSSVDLRRVVEKITVNASGEVTVHMKMLTDKFV